MASSLNNMLAARQWDPPLLDAQSKNSVFNGRQLMFVASVSDWCFRRGFTNVNQMFQDGPVCPLFYRSIDGNQVIDWNAVEEGNQEVLECGLYDKNTGQLVLGVRMMLGAVEEFNFGKNTYELETNLVLMGEFKNGKLNGRGRIWNEQSQWFYEGTFVDNKLVRHKLALSSRGSYQFSFLFETPDQKIKFAYNVNFPSEEQGSHIRAYDTDGSIYKAEYVNGDLIRASGGGMDGNTLEGRQEIAAKILQIAPNLVGQEMQDYLKGGIDARQAIGMDQDPLGHVQMIAGKYKIIRAIEKFRRYEVQNIQTQEQLQLLWIDNKKSFELCIKNYTSHQHIQNEMPMVDSGEHEVHSLCKFTCFFIITHIPRTLDAFVKSRKLNMHDKLNMFFNIFWEYDLRVMPNQILGTISPENIMVANAENYFYFINLTEIQEISSLKPRQELKNSRPTNPLYPDWKKREDFLFPTWKLKETLGCQAHKLTWSLARMNCHQMQRSDDLEQMLYLYCWIMNDGCIPVARFDFNEGGPFKGNFDVFAYCKYNLHSMIFELISQIKNQKYSYHPLKDITYADFKLCGLTYRDTFSWMGYGATFDMDYAATIQAEDDVKEPTWNEDNDEINSSNINLLHIDFKTPPSPMRGEYHREVPSEIFELDAEFKANIVEHQIQNNIKPMDSDEEILKKYWAMGSSRETQIKLHREIILKIHAKRIDVDLQIQANSAKKENRKDEKPRLLGYLIDYQLEDDCEQECFKCQQSLQGERVWRNEYGNCICFECCPSDNYHFKLLRTQEQDYSENSWLSFDALDKTRVDSILNSNGNQFTYKQKQCNDSLVQLPDFLLNKNKKYAKFSLLSSEPTAIDKYLTSANFQHYLCYKNIVIRLISNGNQEQDVISLAFLEGNDGIYEIFVPAAEFESGTNFKLNLKQEIKPHLVLDQYNGYLLKFGQGSDQIQKQLHPFTIEIQPAKLFPSSNVYRLQEGKGDRFKQMFTVIYFTFSYVMQTFDVELVWEKGTGSGAKPLGMKVVNSKMLLGVWLQDARIRINNGEINGFKYNFWVQETKDYKWSELERSKPSDFSFKTCVSFNRYTQIDHSFILESQITDAIRETFTNESIMAILQANLFNLINMVPGKLNLKNFDQISKYNWLQPMECLGGRSLSQFMIGANQAEKMLDRDNLKLNRQPTVIDISKSDPNIMEIYLQRYLDLLKPLETESFEMHFDFSHRTAIHDCLDFKQLSTPVEYRSCLIKLATDCFFESKMYPQILTGIFGLVIEQVEPIPEMSHFLNDAGDQSLQTMFSEIKREDAVKENLPVLSDKYYQLQALDQQSLLAMDQRHMRSLVFWSQYGGDSQDKGDIKVKHFLSDWSQAFLQSKLQAFLNANDQQVDPQAVRHGDRDLEFDLFRSRNGFNESPYQTAKLTERIMELYSDDIENQKVMQAFIDSQFSKTKVIIMAIFAIYLLFFAVPFIIQAFLDKDGAVLGLNISCFLVQLLLMAIEIIQVIYLGGIRNYLSEFWNYFDILHFVLYITYFLVRLIRFQDKMVIPAEGMKTEDHQAMIFWVTFNSAMFVLITQKLMFFMRVSDNFASLVKLVGNVLRKVPPFTLFFFMWLVTLCLMFSCAGVSIVSEDYSHIYGAVAFFIQNFRNSIGDINAPSVDIWKGKKSDDSSPELVGFAYWGWLLFVINEFFLLIILLNFLIAIISQCYEEVMSQEVINRYQSRSSLNLEIAILIDAIKYRGSSKSEKCNTVLYLMAHIENGGTSNEFMGFVKTIKTAIKKENKILKEEIKKAVPTSELILNLKQQVEDTKGFVEQVRAKMELQQSEMNEVKDRLNTIQGSLDTSVEQQHILSKQLTQILIKLK